MTWNGYQHIDNLLSGCELAVTLIVFFHTETVSPHKACCIASQTAFDPTRDAERSLKEAGLSHHVVSQQLEKKKAFYSHMKSALMLLDSSQFLPLVFNWTSCASLLPASGRPGESLVGFGAEGHRALAAGRRRRREVAVGGGGAHAEGAPHARVSEVETGFSRS